MPFLQEKLLVLCNYLVQPVQFFWTEPQVSRKLNRFEPKLGRKIGPIDVNVSRFIWFVAVVIEPTWTYPQNSWHF